MPQIQFESLCKYKYRLLADLVLQTNLRGYYARAEYVEIRDNGDTAIMQLTACQAFIKAVTQK